MSNFARMAQVEIDKSDVNANSLNVDQFLQPQWWIPEVDGAAGLHCGILSVDPGFS